MSLGFYGNYVGGQNIVSYQEVPATANFSGTSTTVSLGTTIDANSSIMIVKFHNNTASGNKEGYNNLCNFQLSNTQVTVTKYNATAGSYTYTLEIVEFDPLIIKSNQFVSANVNSSNGYVDVAVSAISLSNKRITLHHGNTTTEANNWLGFSPEATMQSTTSLTLGALYTGTLQTKQVRGQVLEFTAGV